ncbi:type II toxin-antitoxin system HipA family toxin [Longimicrobium sp.]|uniref:type II toxin-antitoxin system HipA family toxin n=1 Tax=Longimicrobium sp. TaxID=2029185 RepID=UPI002BA2A860|nr:type II toxin-antitoxin system HipA family toxin [Longimicrobium sp.]HSU13278.1 type II toxin-antitoxin system HipA family toxin [Longimicrobium sp.]
MRQRAECFVYLQMPGTLEVVTCGRFEREVTRTGRAVGRFVYGRSYRARTDAVPLDPYHLPISSTVRETAKLDGVFGALRDAAPDAWGRRVIERILGRPDLDEVDFLLESPQDRAGALSFGRGTVPPAPVREFNRVVQLAELRRAVGLLEDDHPGEPVARQILDLLEPGTSLGGARPKNVVEDEAGLWIAKFPQRGDRWNNAPVEAAMLALAARCGIRVPETRVERVGDEAVLLVKRFDRERVTGEGGEAAYLRHRMVSALTVLDVEESPTDRAGWSYVLLADELQRWSGRPREDRAELFRRVVLNALISNVDDHPRNHALIAPGRAWRLAPAYDLTPNPRQGIEGRRLAMECGRFGRIARRDNLLSAANHFGFRSEEANAVIDEMKVIVERHWRSDVLQHGGSERDCRVVEPAFVYPGFEYATSS